MERFKSKIDQIKKGFVIENLDPEDKLLRLIPGIIKEHVIRYKYATDKILEISKEESPLIVDLASGRGYGSDILSQVFKKSTVIGLEIGKDYIKQAQDKYGQIDKDNHPHFVSADVRQTPLQKETADAVTAFEIIEHLPEKDQPHFVQEIARILKPGGLAFISIPKRYSFKKNRHGKFIKTGVSSNPHHLFEPTIEELSQYVKNSGLNIIEKAGQAPVNKKILHLVDKISQLIPLKPFYAWSLPRDMKVKTMPDTKKTPLTHIIIAQKPNSFHPKY